MTFVLNMFSIVRMSRIADETLLTHFEIALAVASPRTLAALGTADLRAQRRARLDLAHHLVDRLRAVVADNDGARIGGTQPGLFSDDLSPMG